MSIRPFKHFKPQVGAYVYIDEQACVIGNVSLAEDVSVWPMAVLRGDVNSIAIGKGSNIQDNCTLHVTHKTAEQPNGAPLTIGEYVTVGHQVTLHGCTIGNRCLIGIGSVILDKAVVQDEVLIGAGTLVTAGKILASGFLYLGSPVEKVRALTVAERSYFLYSAKHYITLKNAHIDSR